MQTRTPEEIEKQNEDIELRCPISQDYLRYSILASDNKHYELDCLLAWIASGQMRSPSTNIPLTHVSYDRAFQEKINVLIATGKLNKDEVYPEYDNAEKKLQQLHKYLPTPSCWQDSMLYSINTSAALTIVIALSLIFPPGQKQEPSTLNIGLLALGLFALDFFLRWQTKHQYGLFTLFREVRNVVDRLPTSRHIHDLEGFFDRPAAP